jgi:diguanylate cyclase (GGDEF)-like protein/PAS domain S-box-containing protein
MFTQIDSVLSGTRLSLLLLSLCASAQAQQQAGRLDWLPGNENTGMLALAGFSLSGFIALGWRLRREIALRRQVESRAISERSRLNAILDNAGVGVMITDRNARHIDVNRRWCRMFGYRRHEARGKLSIRDIVHPDEVPSIVDQFQSLLSSEVKSQTHARRFMRKDGRVFWGVISTSTVRDKSGRFMWAVGIITDIDAQKRNEVALRESEERLRFITENTHDVVWQLDQNLCFTYINSADERMRGFHRSEVIGSPFKSLIAPCSHAVFDQEMQQQQADRTGDAGEVNFEVELCCKDGGHVWAEVNSTSIHDDSGKIIGYIGVTRDATQRRRTHEKLREQTIRDPLTGLFNRRYLDESLERELARAKRDQLPLAILMIDIDCFKRLNDTYGHQAGDEVLRTLGESIRNCARTADLPCRYGGEEFLLVLPNISIETACERAERWRSAFEKEVIVFGKSVITSTVSIGVATYPVHGDTRESLIRSADEALYRAKHSGRNRVVVAS